MFGYSLSFLNNTLLIGAPKVNGSTPTQGITEPGGVYSCQFSGDMQCDLLDVDSSYNNIGKWYSWSITPGFGSCYGGINTL